jgi:hypothetical protein
MQIQLRAASLSVYFTTYGPFDFRWLKFSLITSNIWMLIKSIKYSLITKSIIQAMINTQDEFIKPN